MQFVFLCFDVTLVTFCWLCFIPMRCGKFEQFIFVTTFTTRRMLAGVDASHLYSGGIVDILLVLDS